MEQANNPRRRSATAALAAVVAISALTYWTGNGVTALWDRDEPRFAEASAEMIETGDYIVPRFQGRLRPDKPILGYWFFVAGMKVFGINEFGARFASGLFGVLSVIVLYDLARRMTGKDRTALMAAAMLATAPVMFVESKLCTVDAGLLFWLLLVFNALWRIYDGGCTWRAKAVFWAALSLAVLTKGPVALAAVFPAVALMAILSGDRSFLKRMGWLWGVPLFLAVALPWAVAVQMKTGGEFLSASLGRHVVGRAAEAMEGHAGFPGFYIATMFGTFFPWSLFVPGALWQAARGLRGKKVEIFLVSWTVGLVVVLELVSTKMVHYSLPVFPALAILVALFVERRCRPGDRLFMTGALTALAMSVCIGAGPAIACHRAGMKDAVFALAGAGGILIAGIAWAAASAARGRFLKPAAATMFAWLFVMGAWAMPVVSSYGSTPAALAAIADARAEASEYLGVAALGYEEPSLVFGLGGELDLLEGRGDFAVGVGRVPRLVVVNERSRGALEDLPNRIISTVGEASGFNFAKGRFEKLTVFLDEGSVVSVVFKREGADGDE